MSDTASLAEATRDVIDERLHALAGATADTLDVRMKSIADATRDVMDERFTALANATRDVLAAQAKQNEERFHAFSEMMTRIEYAETPSPIVAPVNVDMAPLAMILTLMQEQAKAQTTAFEALAKAIESVAEAMRLAPKPIAKPLRKLRIVHGDEESTIIEEAS